MKTMDTRKDIFSSPTLVVITGTSRGYGVALSKCFSAQLQDGSVLVLTGRNVEKMMVLSKQLTDSSSNDIQVEVIACDLRNTSHIEEFFEKLQKKVNSDSFKSAILVNNAGTLGDVSLTIDKYDYSDMKEYLEMNVTNALYFSNKFVSAYNSHNLCVVNVSSLCAIKAFPTCGMYCISKAARDMAFKVLALERSDIRVLNWAPGPMPTEMFEEMTKAADKRVSEPMGNLLTSKTYVECHDSAEKLIVILKKNDFESGAHIDYYDDL